MPEREAALPWMGDTTKTFPGVFALDRISFRLRWQSVHTQVDQNGAGKSTFVPRRGAHDRMKNDFSSLLFLLSEQELRCDGRLHPPGARGQPDQLPLEPRPDHVVVVSVAGLA